ncbi:secreted insulinase-like peptidase [Cryptosporidium ubiquitum]|uniref:Secreted insulinase-like peptidase n=1 Tax=Cryptosporidium ubiquitum TaxID=857276 RepID=A0A1J4MJK8_9CRYT|nr:secreted insulinase-like peptidase [Cryptosporidium ubiquitum]OII74390.1 secreted insulinase-like peptidase [Cryptosporidium ubiquitum]
MIKRCWYLALYLFILIVNLYLEICFALIKQEAIFLQSEANENKKLDTPNSFAFKKRRKRRLNGRKCVLKNHFNCSNNCNDDLIRIMLPEKKFKHVEEMIDDELFEKPSGFTRKYRYLRLSNSLKVFMVYDKTAETSFGNMHLDFGFASDPENIPGLSRYLLYTVLFGSLKKRLIKNFDSVVKKFEGIFGATIHRDCSRYSFNIPSNEFEVTLKFFASMFVNLYTDEYIHKDILNKLLGDLIQYINLDSFRLSDVLQEIAIPPNTEKSNHDWNILEYMQIQQLDKLKSKKLLLEFFNQYYRADRMTLTILSNKTLDEQTSIVRKYFNKIRRGDSNIVTRLRLLDLGMNHPLYGSTGKILVFHSLKSYPFIKLLFPLNNIFKPKPSSKPMFFFSMYISSKRKGSLYYYLYKNELITDMKIYLSNSLFGYYSLIVDVRLQNSGELAIIHIIRSIFSVFEMMRNNQPKLELFNQVRALKMKKFKHKSNSFIFNECSYIQNAFCLLKCTPEKVLSASSTYTEFNLELHHKILSYLKPENMLLIATSRSKKLKSLIEFMSKNSNETKINHKSDCNDSLDTSILKENTTSCQFCKEQLLTSNNLTFPCIDCFSQLGDLRGFDYSILFENCFNESEIIISNFTRTNYFIKKIHPFFISYWANSVKPYTAFKTFEIYDPDNKFLRIKEPKNFLLGFQEQDVPIRLVDAIQNLGSKRYNKIINKDFLKDYQQIFYLPLHSINTPKSSISITIKLPPNLYSNELPFPYSPTKLEVIFSMISLMLLKSFEDIMYYYKKLSTNLDFSINTPVIYSFYTYGLTLELTGITDHLSHALSTIAYRIKDFPNTARSSDLNVAKNYYLGHIKNNNLDHLPAVQFQSILKALLFNQNLTSCSINNEIEKIRLHEVTSVVDFLVKNGTFEGLVYGNINPIKVRELLLLFFINIGRTSNKEENFNKKQNIFLKMFSLFKNSFFNFFNSIRSTINQLTGNLTVQSELPEHLKSVPTQHMTQNTLRDLQVIDLLSFKEGSSFVYFGKPNFDFFQFQTIVLKICFGYFTVEVESLVDILVETILNKHQDKLKIERGRILITIKRNIFSDGIVSIDIRVTSKNMLSELILYIMKLYDDLIVNNSGITYEDFISTKKSLVKSLSNNSSYDRIINFKEEIRLKRYQFNRKKEKVEFISKLNYSNFLKWFNAQPPKVIKLLFVIHSPSTSEKEILKANSNIPLEFKRINSTDYFFKQNNTRSFNPSQIYNLK